MIRKALWMLLLVGYIAMVWHGATGDTGPMGWLNALRQHWTGGYSRKLSFMAFCFGTIALSSPILLPLLLTSPAKPPSAVVPAPASKPTPGWKTAALAWSIPVALAWIATVLTAVWTTSVLGIAGAHAKQAWSERRRTRRAAQGIGESPRKWVWIGGRFHRW